MARHAAIQCCRAHAPSPCSRTSREPAYDTACTAARDAAPSRLLPRLEMMLRDQTRRNFALAELASDPVGVLMTRKIMFGSAGRHVSKIVGEADVQNPPRSSTSALNARS